MNCIFVCIFNNQHYVNMFYLLLESIFIYGNLDDNTHILVYTSTPFMKIIKESHLFNQKIIFEINDSYNNVDKACKSRLDLFNFESIKNKNYNKIIYLDTDILIKDDINKVFDVIKDDLLYVLEEGNLMDDDAEYWGKSLFGDELNNYINDTSAFTSGVLLFNNCQKIENLFNAVKDDMLNRPGYFSCYDQPYIVYNAFKYNVYDNKALKKYVVNMDENIYSDKVIHHFPGVPGYHARKIDIMAHFIFYIKDYTIWNNIQITKNYINQYLLPIIHESGELLEGNIFMLHHTTQYTDEYIEKAKNISNLVLNKNIKNVCEIGFNAGFSALLILISNPNIILTCYDLCEHRYTISCYLKIKETFGDRINLISGDSTKTLSYANGKYDLIHIDGGHDTYVAESDIINSYRLSKQGTILIMDDYNFGNLHELWDTYINKYILKNLDIKLYSTPHHDVKYVLK